MLPENRTSERRDDYESTVKKENISKLILRYKKASRNEKTIILDEFCATCGYHRKHAIRLLRRFKRFIKPKPNKRGKSSASIQRNHPQTPQTNLAGRPISPAQNVSKPSYLSGSPGMSNPSATSLRRGLSSPPDDLCRHHRPAPHPVRIQYQKTRPNHHQTRNPPKKTNPHQNQPMERIPPRFPRSRHRRPLRRIPLRHVRLYH